MLRIAPALEGPAHEPFVAADAVHVGGVPEGDAAVDRVVEQVDGLRILARAVELGHPHAAESDGRYFESARAKLTFLHVILRLRQPFTDRSHFSRVLHSAPLQKVLVLALEKADRL
jgi:hypothetical protein